MRIRSYKPTDYDKVKLVLQRVDLFDKSYDTKTKFDSKKPKGSIIVAEDGNKTVGVIIYTWDGWDSSIYRLAVDPDYQNHGIGTRLLDEAESRLKKKGADISSLRVSTKNKRAQKFFKERGYKVVSSHPYLDMERKL